METDFQKFLDELRSRVSVADVVGAKVKLVRKGKEYMGLCPFHNEKTPSFSVKKEDNIFKCFGCGESGDAITFVAKLKGIEPIEAAREIAEKYHIEIEDKKYSKSSTITDYLKRCIADVSKTDGTGCLTITLEIYNKKILFRI